MELYRFLIFGRVQGVYYRKAISQAAAKKQIRGYIRNLPDGSVEVIAEIIEDDLDDFVELLKIGSPLSHTDEVSSEVIDDADLIYDGFEIRS